MLLVWVGEVVEELEDLLLGLAFEVGEEVEEFVDQGVVVGRVGELDGGCGNFFFWGLRWRDLLLWTGDRRIGV